MSPHTSGTGRSPPVRQRLQAVHLLRQFSHLMTQAVALFAVSDRRWRRIRRPSRQNGWPPAPPGSTCVCTTGCWSTSRQNNSWLPRT